MTDLTCHKCGKRLSKKTARMVEGRVICSACLFAPRKSGEAGTAKTAKTGLVHEHAVANGDAPNLGTENPMTDKEILPSPEGFEREERYIVIKRKRLTPDDERAIRQATPYDALVDCVVVERDWPEYEPVWAMIKQRVAIASMPHSEQVEITSGETVDFLNHAFRNIDLPPLSPADVKDIAGGLTITVRKALTRNVLDKE